MQELLILLVVIAVIAIIWYLRKGSARPAEQRPDEPVANRTSLTGAVPAATQTRGTEPQSPGLLQGAADSAAGLHYERAADQMEGTTADLAKAREDAEQAAERLASQTDEALASIQAAAAAHGGAVPGDGTHSCPSSYPIKGNLPSMHYHTPNQPSYARTIPEVCFRSAEAAEAAGFTKSGDEVGMRAGSVPGDGTQNCPAGFPIKGNLPSMHYHTPNQPSYARTIPEVCFRSAEAAEAAGYTRSGDETGMRSGVVDVEEVMAEEVAVINDRRTEEEVVVEAVEIRDQEGERVDVVEAAIAAADAGGVPPGAVRGDGSRDCPLTYPIKGNQNSMLYHEPGTPTYLSTVPEFCFSSVDAAQAAGFSATRG